MRLVETRLTYLSAEPPKRRKVVRLLNVPSFHSPLTDGNLMSLKFSSQPLSLSERSSCWNEVTKCLEIVNVTEQNLIT